MTQETLIEIRELTEIHEFRRCVELQREAFGLPDSELSPLRHFVVSINCGGFVLGAFADQELIGFVHHLVALKSGETIGYSHVTAIATAFQNAGVGARLKWAQRDKALARGEKFIKWTFDPLQSRNAHFNLNRLGATIKSYAANYYGTDYLTMAIQTNEKTGLDSDRLFAEWQLDDKRVAQLARGEEPESFGRIVKTIEIPADWKRLIETDAKKARAEQTRVRQEFQTAFASNLTCAGFERGDRISKYLFY